MLAKLTRHNGTQEPTGADTSFDKWNYYCGAVWSFSWARLGLVISSSQGDLTFRCCSENLWCSLEYFYIFSMYKISLIKKLEGETFNIEPSLSVSFIFCVWTELYNFDTICDDPGSLSGWNAGLQMMLIILQRSPGTDPMLYRSSLALNLRNGIIQAIDSSSWVCLIDSDSGQNHRPLWPQSTLT